MTENPLIEKIRQMKPALEKHGVKRVRIFGSVARGDDRPDSDIDLLVEYAEGVTLFDVIDIQEKLENHLGRKVDLVTLNSMYGALKDRVLNEARDV